MGQEDAGKRRARYFYFWPWLSGNGTRGRKSSLLQEIITTRHDQGNPEARDTKHVTSRWLQSQIVD
jgi:hypothetical protein